MVCIDHQLNLEGIFPLIIRGFYILFEVDYSVLLPDGILDSLRSLDCLEMNGVQSKANSLRSIKHMQAEPPVRKSQLTCSCCSSAVTCMLVSQFSVNDQKPIKQLWCLVPWMRHGSTERLILDAEERKQGTTVVVILLHPGYSSATWGKQSIQL